MAKARMTWARAAGDKRKVVNLHPPEHIVKSRRRSINGDALDCKSAALGTTGSIPVFSTKLV